MSCGFDVLAGIAGFVQLGLALTAACIKGLAIISEASRFSQDAGQVGCMIELELHRLISWAGEVGLWNPEPELKICVNDCNMVCETLQQLDILLTDLSKLKREYNLTLRQKDEVYDMAAVSKTVVGKLVTQDKRKLYRDAISISQRQSKTGPWKKLKWVYGDAERVEKLLEKVRVFIYHLERMLEKTQRDRLEQVLDTLMRKVVFNTQADQELNAIIRSRGCGSKGGEAAATARFKRKYLEVGESIEGHTSQKLFKHTKPDSFEWGSGVSIGRSHELDICHIQQLEQLDSSAYRSTGVYQGQHVVIEWKYFDDAASSILEYRVQQVTTLLRRQTDPSFHSLRCLGYVPDVAWSRYGYLFGFPGGYEASNSLQKMPKGLSSSMSLSTLRNVLSRNLAEPSLNVRVEFAAALLQTVRQLHTAQVVHKSICSENVLLFNSSGGGGAESSSNIQLYLGGYAYSRLASPLERTEVPESRVDADLYRHPLSIGDKRPPFHMSFDLYSLGCVLLELGLWRPLCDIFHELGKEQSLVGAVSQSLSLKASQNSYTQKGKERILSPKTSQSVRQRLEAKTGEKYSDLVFACLDTSVGGADKEQYQDGPLLIQDSCLALLEGIHV